MPVVYTCRVFSVEAEHVRLPTGRSHEISIVRHPPSVVLITMKDPGRVIIDLWVKDIDAEHARLEAQGVPFSRSKGVEHWGAVLSTFSDPDGNTIQLFQDRPGIRTVPAPAAT